MSTAGRRAVSIVPFVWLFVVCAAQELPTPAGAINDFANVLSAETESSLKTIVESVEKATTAEIAVATIPSLGGTTVEDYAERLFKAWGVGQKGRDNGVLVLIAPTERKIRIEVGYGLEGVLPDGLAGAVIRDAITPAFRAGDVDKGVLQGVTRVADIVRRNETLTAEQLRALEQEPPNYAAFFFVPFFGLFVAIGGGVLGAGLRHGDRFFVTFGSAFGGVPLLVSALFGLWSIVILVILGLTTLCLGYFRGDAIGGWVVSQAGSGSAGSGSRSSSWSGSSRSSSSHSSSSSSSSSSSDSFGGGRSGGGGASGSW